MTKHFLTKTVSDTIHYSFGTEIFCVVWRLKEKLECGFAQLYLFLVKFYIFICKEQYFNSKTENISVFWSLFLVEIDVKDIFLPKNDVPPCKNVTLVYKGKYLKIERKFPTFFKRVFLF